MDEAALARALSLHAEAQTVSPNLSRCRLTIPDSQGLRQCVAAGSGLEQTNTKAAKPFARAVQHNVVGPGPYTIDTVLNCLERLGLQCQRHNKAKWKMFDNMVADQMAPLALPICEAEQESGQEIVPQAEQSADALIRASLDGMDNESLKQVVVHLNKKCNAETAEDLVQGTS